MTDDKVTEEEVRALAQCDAEAGGWSIQKVMNAFGVNANTALKIVGLIAIGYSAPRALVAVMSNGASAESANDVTVPGTLTTDSIREPNEGTEAVLRTFHQKDTSLTFSQVATINQQAGISVQIYGVLTVSATDSSQNGYHISTGNYHEGNDSFTTVLFDSGGSIDTGSVGFVRNGNQIDFEYANSATYGPVTLWAFVSKG